MAARVTRMRAFLITLVCALALALCSLVALPSAAHAAGTAKVTGTVTILDASIPGDTGKTATEGQVKVILWKQNADDSVSISGEMTTDSSGQYTFTDLEAGTYYVGTDPENAAGVTKYIRREGNQEASRGQFDLNDGEESEHNLQVYEAIKVSGTVENADGDTVGNHGVTLERGGASYDSTTDSNGKYAFYLFKDANNTETVTVSAYGYTYEGTTYNNGSITVPSNALTNDLTNLLITLTKSSITYYDLFIEGKQVMGTPGEKVDVFGDGSVVFDPYYGDGSYYNPVLILTNATLDECGNMEAVIQSELDTLQIVLYGDNKITVPTSTGTAQSQSYGIKTVSLVLDGDYGKQAGTLTITDANTGGCGINVAEACSIRDGAEVTISANFGIMAGGSTSADSSVYVYASTLNIDADYMGIYAEDFVSISQSSIVDIKAGVNGIVAGDGQMSDNPYNAADLYIDDSNVTIVGAQRALSAVSSLTSDAAFDYPSNVEVKASTEASGANAVTYDGADQSTYKFIQTTAVYTTTVDVPLTLDIKNESGNAIPTTEFNFTLEAYVDPAEGMTASQQKLLKEFIDRYVSISAPSVTVDETGKAYATATLSITDTAVSVLQQYGLKVKLASTPSGWTTGGEQYKIAFIPESGSGNFVVEGFYAIQDGVASGTALSEATFTATYKAPASEQSAEELAKTGDTATPLAAAALALAGMALAGVSFTMRRCKQ